LVQVRDSFDIRGDEMVDLANIVLEKYKRRRFKFEFSYRIKKREAFDDNRHSKLS
jgi:hypothetical protein